MLWHGCSVRHHTFLRAYKQHTASVLICSRCGKPSDALHITFRTPVSKDVTFGRRMATPRREQPASRRETTVPRRDMPYNAMGGGSIRHTPMGGGARHTEGDSGAMYVRVGADDGGGGAEEDLPPVSETDNVKVFVRVRPFNQREQEMGAHSPRVIRGSEYVLTLAGTGSRCVHAARRTSLTSSSAGAGSPPCRNKK